MRIKKVLSLLICIGMALHTAVAAESSCIFKDSNNTEISRLVSGDIKVYAPTGIMAEGEAGSTYNIFSGATVQMLPNDGSTEITSPSSAVPEKAIDGKPLTMARANEIPWNLMLELLEPQNMDYVTVSFASKFYPDVYRVEIAEVDGVWTVIAEESANASGGAYTFNFEQKAVKYVRITNLSTEKKMGVCEVEYFVPAEAKAVLAAGLYDKTLGNMYSFNTLEITPGMSREEAYVRVNVDGELTGLPAEIPEQENLVTGAAVRFLSNTTGSELPASGISYAENAIDKNPDTFACAAEEWTYTFEADMGEVKNVGKIVICFAENSYPVNYDILISENGSEWQTVGGDAENASGGMREFNFKTVPAKYIRVRDNVAQPNVRQMGILELEVYENAFISDYEIRAFLLEKDEKTPYDGKVYRLNDEKISYEENIFSENTAEIDINKEICIKWTVEDASKPLSLAVKKGDETIYMNVLTPEECKIGSLTMLIDELEDGDTVTVMLAGGTDFETELVYDTVAITYEMFKTEFEEASEGDILDVVLKYDSYVNAENSDKLSALSDEERAAVKAAVLNGKINSFEDVADIIDSNYGEILQKREEAKNNTSSGISSGSSGGKKTSARVSASVVIPPIVPQAENTYEYDEPEPQFDDIDNVAWAKDSIVKLYKKGVINGTGENTFSPELNVTRGQFIKMLAIAFDTLDENAVCDFDDVAENHWSYSYIASAYKYGLINGMGENYFGAEEYVTRQDAAVMLYRFMKNSGKAVQKGEAVVFADKDDIADYAAEAVDFMSANGIISGVGEGRFEPETECNRAMAAKIICMAAYGGDE